MSKIKIGPHIRWAIFVKHEGAWKTWDNAVYVSKRCAIEALDRYGRCICGGSPGYYKRQKKKGLVSMVRGFQVTEFEAPMTTPTNKDGK